MTWYEIGWLLSFPIIVLLGLIGQIVVCHYIHVKDTTVMELTVLLVVLVLLGGIITGMVQSGVYENYKLVSKVELKAISTTLTTEGLDVVFDDHSHLFFDNHQYIEKWKNGGKFYKEDYTSHITFGPDMSKTEYTIK